MLSLSPIADDPRVRRQAEAFHRAGWHVVAVGMPGARSAAPEWGILSPGSIPPSAVVLPGSSDAAAGPASAGDSTRTLVRQLRRARLLLPWIREGHGLASEPPLRRYRRAAAWALRPAARSVHRARYALRLLATRLRPAVAENLYWSFSDNVRAIYACAARLRADIWLANDWTMLPLAARLAQENSGSYVYDTHEFAAEEYAEKWRWRLWQKPLVCALERQFIGDAAVVSAVSGGIAERLDAMYHLKRPTMVIRNTPNYECHSFRPTGSSIRVLYHGIVAVGRGLEAAIDSVASWQPGFDLTIRGPENPEFSDSLRRRIRIAGLEDRVRLVPPVPMTELVQEAAPFDIGFFALPGHSRHNEFALPNKFFEYLMAGLALCVSDLPEMARLVKECGLGVLIPRVEPAAIAAAINSLDRQRIDAYKQNALSAARELCWERESGRLVSAYRAVAG